MKIDSISNRFDYKNVCLNAAKNDFYFDKFKQNKAYNSILEHVDFQQGLLYIENINKNFEECFGFIENFKKNDLYGGSKLEYYENFGNISPSTLRYIKVLSDIKKLFGDLNGKKIIEIGVGYGGQCFILNQFYNNIEDYFLIDIDEALELSNVYLNKLNVKHSVCKINEIDNIEQEFDLVISNYAYSEVNKELQDFYYDKIIKKSKHGYFTFNFVSHLFGIDSYSEAEILKNFSEKDVKIMEEYPKTHSNNKIIYF
jgi:hypothetical protein